jgi:hypothetical protein
MSSEGKKGLLSALLFFLLTVALFVFIVQKFFVGGRTEFGATFSHEHAEYLGLHGRDTYIAILDELKVRKLRIPLFWSEIETSEGHFNWSNSDFFLDEAEKRGAKITLAIGYKTPRWPECHIPAWVTDPDDEQLLEEKTTAYLTAVVNRYKDHPALLRYQVENEPLFAFGECPKLEDLGFLRREVELVKKLDPNHDIQLTASGEQEAWLDLSALADVVGVSLYRFAWNDKLGFTVYPHTPLWYALERLVVSPWVHDVVISELQAEPWFEGGVIPEDIEKAYGYFPVERLREHISFARETHFKEVYVWGVEWWYYLLKHGESRLWDEGKKLYE